MRALRLVLLAVGLAAPTASAQTAAPTRTECFDAHERAQVARKEGKLRAARQEFTLCANPACPKLVKAECEAERAKVEAALASVVVSALDGGKASNGVKLTVDDERVEARGPLELDPGEHLFRAETADGRRVEKRVSLRPGQRGETVVLDVPPARAPEPEPGPTPGPETPRVSPAVWVLGGVAVLGLGGFVGFGLSGKAKENDLDACKPRCSRDDVDSMRTSYLLADVSLGVALVATGVGAYLYLGGGKKPQERSAYVRALPERAGASVALGASF